MESPRDSISGCMKHSTFQIKHLQVCIADKTFTGMYLCYQTQITSYIKHLHSYELHSSTFIKGPLWTAKCFGMLILKMSQRIVGTPCTFISKQYTCRSPCILALRILSLVELVYLFCTFSFLCFENLLFINLNTLLFCSHGALIIHSRHMCN